MNRLAIFDLDGVLFESRNMHYETLNKALGHYGYPPISPEDHVARFNGLPTRTKLEMLGIRWEDDGALVYREKQACTLGWVFQNVKQDDDLIKLFKWLREERWQIAVASNAITVTVIRALQLLGLWELCDFVTAADRVERPKPHPEMYVRCMDACGSDPAHTFIVEDSPVGREGAARTGALVVAVSGPEQVVDAVRSVAKGWQEVHS